MSAIQPRVLFTQTGERGLAIAEAHDAVPDFPGAAIWIISGSRMLLVDSHGIVLEEMPTGLPRDTQINAYRYLPVTDSPFAPWGGRVFICAAEGRSMLRLSREQRRLERLPPLEWPPEIRIPPDGIHSLVGGLPIGVVTPGVRILHRGQRVFVTAGEIEYVKKALKRDWLYTSTPVFFNHDQELAVIIGREVLALPLSVGSEPQDLAQLRTSLLELGFTEWQPQPIVLPPGADVNRSLWKPCPDGEGYVWRSDDRTFLKGIELTHRDAKLTVTDLLDTEPSNID